MGLIVSYAIVLAIDHEYICFRPQKGSKIPLNYILKVVAMSV